MAEVNKNGRITLNKPLSVSNVVNYPRIGNSEHIMGDLKTCKITISLEDGRNLKKIVKDSIEKQIADLSDEISKTALEQKTKINNNQKTSDYVTEASKIIDNIQNTVKNRINIFMESTRQKTIALDIKCIMFVEVTNKHSNFPVEGTKLTGINLWKKKLYVAFTGIATNSKAMEIDLESLCIDSGTYPFAKEENNVNETQESQGQQESQIQQETKVGGGKKKARKIIRLNKLFNDGSEYDHCE